MYKTACTCTNHSPVATLYLHVQYNKDTFNLDTSILHYRKVHFNICTCTCTFYLYPVT